ncbi:MAG: extracellular solute-binding protein [Propionibacteriaceae bacterium]|jgi:multiple sugar transport system substrate-binding protein|nr:extracellular solute-binding protein [Propionibacteriaceae bacterium]
MLWGNDADVTSIKDAAAGFTTAHPEITIEWETGDCGVDYAACKTLVAGGNLPDVFVMGSWNYFEAARDGVTADITDLLARSGTPTSDFTSTIIKGMTSADGKLYGLPMGYNIQSLFYNKAMFDKAGLSYPAADGSYTYDDLRQWSAKLTLDKAGRNATEPGFDAKSIKQYGYFNFAAGPIEPGYAPVLAAFGGGILGGEARNQCTADASGTIDGFQWLQDLMWKDHSAITPQLHQEEPGYARWVRGQVAMQQGSHEQVLNVQQQNPTLAYDMAALPKGPAGNATLAQIHIWAMAQKSEVKDAAWTFLHYMATDGAGKQMGLIPAYKDVASGPAFAQGKGEPAGLVEAQLTPATWPLTVTNLDPSVVWSAVSSQDGVLPAIEDIVMNRKTASEALSGICAQRIDPLLKSVK